MAINRDELRASLEARSTEELVEIVSLNDEETWHPEVFDLARSILISRGLFPKDVARMWQEAGKGAASPEPKTWRPSTAPPNYNRIADGVWLEGAEEIAECLQAAGIPFCFVEKYQHGLDCYVPAEQARTALDLLVGRQLVPEQPPDEGSGNFCRECGTELPEGASECPACDAAI